MLQIKRRISVHHAVKMIFFGIIILGLIFSTINVLFLPGNAMESVLFRDTSDSFMDLYNPISFSMSANPYTNVDMGAIYPPLAYIIYRNLGKTLKPYLNDFAPHDLRDLQSARMLTLFVTLSGILPLAYLLYRKYRGREWEKLLFIVGVLASSPFLFLIERANCLMWVLWLVLLFVMGYRSSNKWVRELSLVSLAIAFALKLYPAIFGLLLLLDKQYRSAIRCAVYALFLLIVPIFYFNGLSTLKDFISNLQHGISVTVSGSSRVDWSTTLSSWFVWLGGSQEAGLKTAVNLTIPLLLLLGLSTLILKSLWKRCLCTMMIAVLIPSFSFYYVVVLVIIPLFFLLQAESNEPLDIVYVTLMTLMLVLFMSPLGRHLQLVGLRLVPQDGFLTNWCMELCKFCQLCIVILIGADAGSHVIICLRSHNSRPELMGK